MQFSASAPLPDLPADGLVPAVLARERRADGIDGLHWGTEPDGRIRLTAGEHVEVLPILLRRGTPGRPGSEYVLPAAGFTTGELTGRIDGAPDALTGRAGLAYRDHTRGRAIADIRAHPPYGLTTESTIPELRWEGTAGDGATPSVSLDLRLLWATASGELAARDGRLSCRIDLGGRGLWTPVISLLLLVLRGLIQRGLDDAIAELARDIAALCSDPATGDDADEVAPPETPATDPMDFSLLNDLRWLRSPFGIFRAARRLARTTPAAA